MADKIWIKLRRTDDYALESYGKDVLRALDKMAGGTDKWNVSQWHGVAPLGRSKARIERHEDGPEIANLVITQLPNYISAIAALVTLWWNRPRKPKATDKTGLSLKVGEFSLEAPLSDKATLNRAIAVLKSIAKGK